jgi:anaerobic selenocysteine-containing dehydrogenase
MPSASKLRPSLDERSSSAPTKVVESACPLDCPDACSLAVTVSQGRVIALDGGHANPVTDGYICAKVRRFGERVYGPDRLLYPAVRTGRKGDGRFSRVSWDEALDLIIERMRDAIATSGAESILPFSYGGSNGMLTDDNLDATLWRRLGASRLWRCTARWRRSPTRITSTQR